MNPMDFVVNGDINNSQLSEISFPSHVSGLESFIDVDDTLVQHENVELGRTKIGDDEPVNEKQSDKITDDKM